MAGTHLLSNLTEREKFEVERKAYQEVQNQDFDHKHFKEKVLKFGEEAIKGTAWYNNIGSQVKELCLLHLS